MEITLFCYDQSGTVILLAPPDSHFSNQGQASLTLVLLLPEISKMR